MALLGAGVLAIWNDIAPQAEAEFAAWHVGEHMPERVGLAGFLRGRRYMGQEASPRYFNFYEAAQAKVFESAAYRTRLDAPTPWTRQVVAQFANTSRTICEVSLSLGRGDGAWLHTLQLSPADAACEATLRDLAAQISTSAGVVGVHLLKGRAAPRPVITAEVALRGGPDHTADVVLMVEAIGHEALRNAISAADWRQPLEALPMARPPVGGLYAFQYGLTRAELELTG